VQTAAIVSKLERGALELPHPYAAVAVGIDWRAWFGHGGNSFTNAVRINSGRISRVIDTSNPSRVTKLIL